MRTRTIHLSLVRSQISFTVGSALLLAASLASAQAAVAPRAAAPSEPAPAAPVAPTATEPGPATAPSSELGTSDPAAALDASAPAVAPAPSAQPAQPPAGAAVAADAVATPEASGETAAQAEDSADQVAEELSGEAGKVNIYGFTDFTYSRLLSDRAAMNVPPAWYPSFYVGNFNLYFGADLGKKWRTLSEVRFTYLPEGVQTTQFAADGTTTTTRNNSAYPDYADYNAEKKVGGVIIERAYLEYAAHPLFTIRGGQFLTPYGIWNVEHGTTVIVGTTRPYVIGANLFPARQTGLEFYGSYGVSSTQVGYHVTVSNGRGPVDTYRDLDKNAAIGWRFWVEQDTSFGTFTLGTSGYKGRYTDRLQTTTIAPNAAGLLEWKYDYPIQSEYRELALALDLKWTYKGALFQSEAIVRDMAYENGTRPRPVGPAGATPAWTPDQRTSGFYALAGYRLPWMGVMPYFGGEYYYLGKASFFPDALAIWGGLNIRPTERVVLKLQATHAVMLTDWLDGWQTPKAMNQLITQAAWSF